MRTLLKDVDTVISCDGADRVYRNTDIWFRDGVMRYFTNGSKLEITDALAEGLLRTVMQFAVVLHKDPLNYQARAEIMWAGSLTGSGTGRSWLSGSCGSRGSISRTENK